ncbi:uncharacterized protein MONOS_1413c1 [Monocercomonoides exilis]|uniref:uncharacterized protein n=1 Tax=Monocercomonoides exilis TaxID=2049356 RepID=UPI00355A65C1|nr:hypothetical protein MONOS_1413c2 [Monocercomonoides exilis]KAH7822877.1 hypothetical protein MONOS_1413c1 [Monocercomonoides exilis]|eukprot:MONOS_1413.1-p1 / transcript=MONOS_1413.1 / gene=MONOS_1413 / organism=Monocercomonoides_exilis_PA203 / gene_product=unspecified product / transcript_product=unspecified product / location=Mono_scaffold00024:218930-219632(-) / protein_length=149 / sequence_SO=supercontig / SO=protein_coding / is_pseudo=false
MTGVFDQSMRLSPRVMQTLNGYAVVLSATISVSLVNLHLLLATLLQPSTAQLVFRSAQSRNSGAEGETQCKGEGADGAAGGDEEEHRAQQGGVVSVCGMVLSLALLILQLGPCEKNQEKIAVIIKYGSAVVLVAHTSGIGVVVKLGVG